MKIPSAPHGWVTVNIGDIIQIGDRFWLGGAPYWSDTSNVGDRVKKFHTGTRIKAVYIRKIKSK